MSDLSPKDFAGSFKGFLDTVAKHGPDELPVFVKLLKEHFGGDPTTLPVIAESFDTSDHPNVQVALDGWLAEKGRTHALHGVVAGQGFMDLTLSELLGPEKGGLMGGGGPSIGPVQFTNLPLANEKVLACVQRGLYLVKEGKLATALLVRGPNVMGFMRKVSIDVMARERKDAEAVLADLRLAMRKRNVYRGRVVSLNEGKGPFAEGQSVQFHDLPPVAREQIVLPEGVLQRVERETIGFSKHAERLKATGRHLKRGILLHGPPGTGKTMTAMYLAGQMKERTTLLIVGRALGLIERSCAMARLLQPSIVVIEDVDLVAEDRTSSACKTPVLFELLNQMDGLADDTDVIFLLTTNRPDVLEPALASRPGRVDLALEIPLPDAQCRRRLFEVYGKGLKTKLDKLESHVSRTEGVSAAFIRELVRKAALFAADERAEIVVEDRHMEQALHELVVAGGELTKAFLGFGPTKKDR